MLKKPLSLRSKVGLVFIIGSAFLLLFTFIVLRDLFLGSYLGLERDDVHRNVDRAVDAIGGAADQLDIKLSDWSTWDDTYAFIEDHNDAYKQSNLQTNALTTLELNFMVFFDVNGQIVYGKAANYETNTEVPFTNLNNYFVEHSKSFNILDPGKAIHGLIELPDGLALVAARPILQSDNSGPARGTLVFGKYMSPDFVTGIEDVTHLSVDLLPLGSSELPEVGSAERMTLNNSGVAIKVMSDTAVTGFARVDDIERHPVAVVRVNGSRPIYTYGTYVFQRAVMFLFLFIGLIAVFLLLVLERYVMGRLIGLNTEIQRITRQDARNAFVTESELDEIGLLALTINAMLKKIGEARALNEEYTVQVENEVKRRTLELSDEKARFVASVNSLRLGFAIVDPDGKVTLDNPSLAKILELKAGPKSLNAISKLLQQKIELFTRLEECMTKRCVIDIKDIVFNGRFLQLFITPVFAADKGGTPLGGVLLLEDVTDEKLIDRAKSEFVSLASHQLRTPLSAINWYIEMLQTGDAGELNKDQLNCVNEISLGNHRMVNLVNSLLEVSRLEVGSVVIEPEPIDVAAMVKELLKTHEVKIAARKLSVKTRLAKVGRLLGDQKYLGLAIDNLISNAIKYTGEGGTVKIEMKSVKAGKEFAGKELVHDGAIISISDTGYGIPKQQQGRVFQKLFRADNVLDKDEEGAGLGLYIAKTAIERIGGQIEFSSQENVGSTFSIYLLGATTPDNTDR